MKRSLVWALCAVSLLAASANAQVVISQVYGGGGNNSATYKNDFIELFNQGSTSVSLAGWSVQYASSTGTSWTNKTNLAGSIAPGGYYLIQGAGGATGAALPTPNVVGTINLSGTSGKVALVNSTTVLTGSCPTGVVDFVGYGGANCFEGSGPTPILDNATAAVRNGAGCADTDDNQADFSKLTPNPRNGTSPAVVCGPRPPLAKATVSPASVVPGASTVLSVTVKLGSDPESPILNVVGDLSPIGGSSNQPFVQTASNTYTLTATVAPSTTLGLKTIAITVTDTLGRTATASVAFKVETEHV
ncbi:MAG TPA: lamin tail domain-containing protein, partial [Thermoanaerobaculia bacterium]|nr:lamin tail domain-containing protein [Thermoanaerobaculia bacterium]